ncbi:MAG: S-layer homology domain-containing protein [Faecousia sp.]
MSKCKRLLSFAVALCLLLGCLPLLSASAAGDAMSAAAVRELLNSVELHPQRTGYLELDEMLEDIFTPYAGSDNYTKLKAAYDWTIRCINYSWAPYSQNWAPAYDCFVPQHTLTYEPGLQEAMPWEIVNRTYHSMAYHEGICYDYAAVFAVMARYIGVDAYVHTGYFIFEAGYGTGSGHHGWAELCIDGDNYIFDPQRDYRMSANGTADIPYYYFGISAENAWRYSPETQVNEARDAGFLPVAAAREYHAVIEASATSAGTAGGSGTYEVGASVTVTAQGKADFVGWFDENGTLCSKEREYTFTAEKSRKLLAVFSGDLFTDIPLNAWYRGDASEAGLRGIINGVRPFIFDSEAFLSRAMAAAMLSRAFGASSSAAKAPFADVPAEAWYANAVAWAKAAGIVNGIGKDRFAPDRGVTREEFIAMLMRCAASQGELPAASELPYSDSADISGYAAASIRWAQAVGLLTGYSDGTLRPQDSLTRAEGVTLLMRLVHWLEAA